MLRKTSRNTFIKRRIVQARISTQNKKNIYSRGGRNKQIIDLNAAVALAPIAYIFLLVISIPTISHCATAARFSFTRMQQPPPAAAGSGNDFLIKSE